MFGLFKRYKLENLDQLKEKIEINRSSYKIAIIDDNEFLLLEELRRHKFDLTKFPDIENVEQLKNYDIIISDIRGVGKKFGSKFEGAHLIEEIHKQYPNKYLVAYSSSTFNPTFNDYFQLCDKTKRKGIDIQEWVNTLEEAIKKINDPVFQWEKTRKILISNKFSLDYISHLEKSYVKSMIEKNGKYLNKEKELIQNKSGGNPSFITKLALDSISKFAATFISNLINHK